MLRLGSSTASNTVLELNRPLSCRVSSSAEMINDHGTTVSLSLQGLTHLTSTNNTDNSGHRMIQPSRRQRAKKMLDMCNIRQSCEPSPSNANTVACILFALEEAGSRGYIRHTTCTLNIGFPCLHPAHLRSTAVLLQTNSRLKHHIAQGICLDNTRAALGVLRGNNF